MYGTTDAEVRHLGMDCLVKNLGIIDNEKFISTLLRWHKKYFADVDLETFLN